MTPKFDVWKTTSNDPGFAWTGVPRSSASFGVVVLHEMPTLGSIARQPAAGSPMLPADVALWAEALIGCGGVAVAPWTGASWWTDGGVYSEPGSPSDITAAIDGAVAWLATNHGLEPPAIAIAGTGVGGHGALRLAYQSPKRFTTVSALRPMIDWHKRLEPRRSGDYDVTTLRRLYGDPERARQDSATLHIHPLNWPRWQRFACPPQDLNHEGTDRLAMKLASLGVPYEAELSQSDSAGYDEAQIATMARWIAERIGNQ